MSNVDVLLVTALQLEHDVAKEVALYSTRQPFGVKEWLSCDPESSIPYLRGVYEYAEGHAMTIALVRPTRMGATTTLPVAAALVERLQPRCLAMCGVCAGNPSDVVLGDVIIAETTYTYDVGKRKTSGFEGDHRQIPMRDTWVRAAQELDTRDLPSFGPVTPEEAQLWLLERLYAGDEPRRHPAFHRYFPANTWSSRVRSYLENKLIRREGTSFKLTEFGNVVFEEYLAVDASPPARLPFEIKVGPMASGNVVVKDGVTWDNLASWGVRTAIGLEMEAASIGALAHRSSISEWIVAKGVMDYADPRKDDRHKHFAARASAEVLFRFLSTQIAAKVQPISLDAKRFQQDHPSVLIVEDDLALAGQLIAHLDDVGIQAIFAQDAPTALQSITDHLSSLRVIVFDLSLPDGQAPASPFVGGPSLASIVRGRHPHLLLAGMSQFATQSRVSVLLPQLDLYIDKRRMYKHDKPVRFIDAVSALLEQG